MIRSYTYYKEDIDDWWEYYNRLPAEFRCVYHRPDYFLFQEEEGMGKAVCQIFEKADRFVYFPALLRPLPHEVEGYDLISSWYYGGPLASWTDWEPFSIEWINAIIEGRMGLDAICEFVRCDPNLRNHQLLNRPYEVCFNRPTVVVDLKTSWEDITRGFSSQNWRNIRKAERSCLDVEIDKSERAWTQFAQIYQEEMLRKDAPPHLRFGNEFFNRMSSLSCFILFAIKLQGTVIGGFVAAHAANIAHHYLSAVRHEHWERRPNNLLFTRVLSFFWEKGFTLFDFQGGRNGVFRFKKNFSKLRNDFFVAKCIYDERRFHELLNRVGERKGNYFPPYRTQE